MFDEEQMLKQDWLNEVVQGKDDGIKIVQAEIGTLRIPSTKSI